MQGSRVWRAWVVSVVALLAVGAAQAQPELIFVPANAALPYAVRAYQEIWDEDGERIVAALKARTCLPFSESSVTARRGLRGESFRWTRLPDAPPRKLRDRR